MSIGGLGGEFEVFDVFVEVEYFVDEVELGFEGGEGGDCGGEVVGVVEVLGVEMGEVLDCV